MNFFLLIYFSIIISGAHESKPAKVEHHISQPGKDTHIYLNYNPNINVTNTNSNTIMNKLYVHIETFAQSISRAISNNKNSNWFKQKMSQPYKQTKQEFTAWLYDHKKKFCFYGLGFLYIAIQGYMMRAHYSVIKNKHRWCNWKSELSIQELQTYSAHQLGVMLIHDIQSRYLNPKNPTDCILPLVSFMKAIQDEEIIITRYMRLITIIKSIKLGWLFWINEKEIDAAHQAQDRLHFLKHIFISWSAQVNLEKACMQKMPSIL